tara:strand:- start:2756 stop:2980 length:225 start_codon:yes stop_codon:yes gene_type:complete
MENRQKKLKRLNNKFSSMIASRQLIYIAGMLSDAQELIAADNKDFANIAINSAKEKLFEMEENIYNKERAKIDA